MEIVSSAFVFAIVAGLELAALKKLVTVKMELVIYSQRLAFAKSTGEENAAMLLFATTAVLKAEIVYKAVFANAKKVGRVAAAQKQVAFRPAKTAAAA